MNTARYRYPTGITIAGSDSCGGAGIQADLKTFSALGVYGMSVITAITAQNTKKICGIQAVDAEVIKNQIDLLFEDFEVDAVKIGMVYRAETVSILADALRRYRPRWIVLDPVLISTSGNQLLEDAAVESMVCQLFPLANLVTPNIPETEFLTRRPIRSENDFEQAAQAFLQMGCSAVLIKGGHGEGKNKTDRYFSKEGENRLFFFCLQLHTFSPLLHTKFFALFGKLVVDGLLVFIQSIFEILLLNDHGPQGVVEIPADIVSAGYFGHALAHGHLLFEDSQLPVGPGKPGKGLLVGGQIPG